MLLTLKDDLGLGLNELGVGILGLPASTLALCFVGTGTGTIISREVPGLGGTLPVILPKYL
jgi:hypothetical protein